MPALTSCQRCGEEICKPHKLCRRCRAEPYRTVQDTYIRAALRLLGFQIWERSKRGVFWRDHEGNTYSHAEALKLAAKERDFVLT